MYARGANFTSLFFMNVYRISLLFDLFSPLYWWFDKKGERYLIYICMFIDKKGGEIFDDLYMHVYFIFLFYNKKGEKDFLCYTKKRRRFLGRRIFNLCMFISLFMHIYICLVLCTLLNILLFICMLELRGSFYEAYL